VNIKYQQKEIITNGKYVIKMKKKSKIMAKA